MAKICILVYLGKHELNMFHTYFWHYTDVYELIVNIVILIAS